MEKATDPFTDKESPIKARKWSGKLPHDNSDSPDPNRQSSGVTARASKDDLGYIHIEDLTAAKGPVVKQTGDVWGGYLNYQKLDSKSQKASGAPEHELLPTGKRARSPSPLFLSASDDDSPLFVPWEDPSSPLLVPPTRKEPSKAKSHGSFAMQRDKVSHTGGPKVSQPISLATPPKGGHERLISSERARTTLVQPATPLKLATPVKRLSEAKFVSPEDIIKRVRNEEREKIKARKQGMLLGQSPGSSEIIHTDEAMLGRKSCSASFRSRNKKTVSVLNLRDSDDDVIPDSDEERKAQKKLAEKLKKAEKKKKTTETRVSKQSTPARAAEQSSRLARKQGPTSASPRVPQLARKSGGIRKNRGHGWGMDGAQDSSEESDDEVLASIRVLFGEVCLENDDGGDGTEPDKSDGGGLTQAINDNATTSVEKSTKVAAEAPATEKKLEPDEKHKVLESMLASASSKYKLSIDKSKVTGAGWGLFTLEDIPAGKEIFSKPVLAYALDFKSMRSACDNCFSVPKKDDGNGELQACPGCGISFYCSQECLNEASESYHWAECWIAQKHPDFITMSATWRIALRVLVRKHFKEGFEPAWKQVMALASNKEKLEAGSVRLQNASTLSRFLKPIMEVLVPKPDPKEKYDMDEFLLRIFLNAGTLLLADGTDLGAILDPFMSMINHDCRPNTFAPVCSEGQMSMRSVRAIKAGEELKVSYVDPSLPVAMRRLYLSTNWQFNCSCVRCRTEMTR